jgi:hypothetical protein
LLHLRRPKYSTASQNRSNWRHGSSASVDELVKSIALPAMEGFRALFTMGCGQYIYALGSTATIRLKKKLANNILF